ncbi:MAG: SPFH domain-containing protein [Fimbriimonadaceae bacterium]|jgi:flotillin|nr:SPFH domain-containing protein [Fimbriimonadaceae bacterium]
MFEIIQNFGETFGSVIIGGIIGLGLVIFFAWFVRTFLRICPPNEALVITGFRSRSVSDGRARGFDVVIGGRKLAIPFFTRVDRISLTTMEVPVAARNAYSKGGIAMNVEAIANVKISSDRNLIGNAIERFLNRDMSEVRRVAKETLEGQLRGVIANLTPEQVNEDRLVFADHLSKETEEDLRKLGLHLDTLKILHVSDEVGYLDATGRKAIANVLKTAEMAESDSRKEAEMVESDNSGRSGVMKAGVDAKVLQMTNELRKIKAELNAKVQAEEERTAAAAKEARAKAEQELQEVRAELEALRLQVERVLPAEAARVASEYQARGDAAVIREKGNATALALDLLYEAWQEAGPNAKQIVLIENIESILGAANRGVGKIHVDAVQVVDGGDGQSLNNYFRSYPSMLGSVFEALDKTVGIDVPGVISGKEDEKK